MKKNIFFLLLFTSIVINPIYAQLNWEQTKGPYGGDVYDINSDKNGNLYVATLGGLYKSENKGMTWSRIPLISDFYGVNEIFVHPSGKMLVPADNLLYSKEVNESVWNIKVMTINNLCYDSKGVIYGNSTKYILKSIDTAKTWKQVVSFKDYIRFFKLSDDTSMVVACDSSVYYSGNLGVSWQKTELKFRGDSGFVADSKKNLYVISDWNPYKSENHGKNWKLIKDHNNPPGVENLIYRVYVDKQDGIYVVSEHEFFYSSDSGIKWKKVGSIPYPVKKLWEDQSGVLYCVGGGDGVSVFDYGTNQFKSRNTGIIAHTFNKIFNWKDELYVQAYDFSYKSSDKGDSWTNTNLPGEFIGIDNYDRLWIQKGIFLWYSNNKELSWTQIIMPQYCSADEVIIVDQKTIIFLYNNKDIYKTEDLGKSWKITSSFEKVIGDRAFYLTSNYDLYLRLGKSLYKSTDKGNSWKKEIEMEHDITCFSESPWGNLFLSTGSGLFIKKLEGWKRIEEFNGNYFADQIYYLENNAMITFSWLYLLISEDLGKTFTLINPSSPNWYSSFYLDDRYAYISARNSNRGLFRASINKLGGSPIQDQILFPNYPNPFNNQTVIKFLNEEEGRVRITIFNTLGERIEELVDEFAGRGYYSKTWQPKNLASGIYFYRLQTPTFSKTKKMILLK